MIYYLKLFAILKTMCPLFQTVGNQNLISSRRLDGLNESYHKQIYQLLANKACDLMENTTSSWVMNVFCCVILNNNLVLDVLLAAIALQKAKPSFSWQKNKQNRKIIE